jgi:hypothetical protein
MGEDVEGVGVFGGRIGSEDGAATGGEIEGYRAAYALGCAAGRLVRVLVSRM